jgi:hypothetical protein
MIRIFWAMPEEKTVKPIPQTAEAMGTVAPGVRRAQENSLKAAGVKRREPPKKPTPPPTRLIKEGTHPPKDK